ncbi:hypothetical protein JCM8547_002630 [Rhodosporidiobolus lusitaniae]
MPTLTTMRKSSCIFRKLLIRKESDLFDLTERILAAPRLAVKVEVLEIRYEKYPRDEALKEPEKQAMVTLFSGLGNLKILQVENTRHRQIDDVVLDEALAPTFQHLTALSLPPLVLPKTTPSAPPASGTFSGFPSLSTSRSALSSTPAEHLPLPFPSRSPPTPAMDDFSLALSGPLGDAAAYLVASFPMIRDLSLNIQPMSGHRARSALRAVLLHLEQPDKLTRLSLNEDPLGFDCGTLPEPSLPFRTSNTCTSRAERSVRA